MAGIDPHQDQFTVGIVDGNGVEVHHESFDNTAAGYLAAIDGCARIVSNRSGSKDPRRGAATL